MTTIELHPEFLTAGGKKQFAVIPYVEFIALQDWIEDMKDLHDLRLVLKRLHAGSPRWTADTIRRSRATLSLYDLAQATSIRWLHSQATPGTPECRSASAVSRS